MIILQANKMTKRFGGQDLFTSVNLSIEENSKVALVGRNGAGKSTLVKMILGDEPIDEGEVTTKKGITIGYLAQNTGLTSDDTIIEEMTNVFADLIALENKIHEYENKMADPNVNSNPEKLAEVSQTYDQLQAEFTAKNGFSYQAEIKAVLNGFGFGEEMYNHKISELSGGQQTQLAMAKLLLQKKDLLILDEPTNHIDVKTISWLEDYLKSYHGALLIISHDRFFMDKIVDQVYDLSQGHMTHYVGNYSSYVEQKKLNYQHQLKEYEKQQKKIKEMQEFVDKNIVRASTTNRAQSRRTQLEKMEKIAAPTRDDKSARLSFTPEKQSGNVVLNIRDAAIGYNHQILSKNINIDVKRNQAVALIGPNGIGKSTLLKTIMKQLPLQSGEIERGTVVQIGYYDQHQDNLHPNKTVLNEIWDDYPTYPEQRIRSILGSFLFSGEDVEKVVGNLSGGEKARLVLTKLSMNHDNFLILDEPTNHLDIDSREVLENALISFDGTILFVSHDRYFINKLATQIVELSPDGSELFLGNYNYYVEKKEEQAAIEEHKKEEQAKDKEVEDPKPKSQNQKEFIANKELQKKQRKLKRQVEDLEEQLDASQKDKSSIEAEMVKPENLNDIEKLNDLQAKLTDINSKIEKIETDWENAMMKLE
ncbi:ABC superfamily ATP binding cassette transporter, ABC protein [Apilactobacillus kunkeei DSM 12361 = ATCC 700308]|uniref:ABC superfamily ATP binding cassette transporter, ABC protein n=1 Tax=Apilactobacillus kunkeei DSM 12361 = ATCC 700308 TaxID=1423768 RepID=A0A0R1FTF9_9LACO|nr:ABC-F family ATP-binding cassette domain-containing protein [Apilactobacillus kunkeei]KOY73513.1 ABC superfamily ATP binding cassette transporter, ABC protein [Apilactobacillus kunkeei DSM 12361 = ATCC 700308]KRK25104.1 ABC superfamily ATP binding cassette transporter, ABC protein [Apilactobacillus kunkeei DSM 12361 = ATCC 700308]QYU53426.1 ABC-F family ATP-binding cassette domain-containing protein [Apilactobacillus kunkeei]